MCALAQRRQENAAASSQERRQHPIDEDRNFEVILLRQLLDNLETNYQRRQDSGAASLQKHPIDDEDDDGLAAPKPIYAGAV